jgi:hypothetical protein
VRGSTVETATFVENSATQQQAANKIRRCKKSTPD